jgi:acetyl-CoA synthetase
MYEEAAADLEGFWQRQAEELIDWAEKPTQTLDESNAPFYKWFADGKLNVTTTVSTVTSRPATATASRSTGAARRARSATSPTPSCTVTSSASPTRQEARIGKGDVVGIYLPMIPR